MGSSVGLRTKRLGSTRLLKNTNPNPIPDPNWIYEAPKEDEEEIATIPEEKVAPSDKSNKGLTLTLTLERGS